MAADRIRHGPLVRNSILWGKRDNMHVLARVVDYPILISQSERNYVIACMLTMCECMCISNEYIHTYEYILLTRHINVEIRVFPNYSAFNEQ